MVMTGGMELFVLVAVVVLLFGGKKIPELASGLGKGIKNFKKAIKDDDEPTTTAEATTTTAKIEEDKAEATTTAQAETTSTETKTV